MRRIGLAGQRSADVQQERGAHVQFDQRSRLINDAVVFGAQGVAYAGSVPEKLING